MFSTQNIRVSFGLLYLTSFLSLTLGKSPIVDRNVNGLEFWISDW